MANNSQPSSNTGGNKQNGAKQDGTDHGKQASDQGKQSGPGHSARPSNEQRNSHAGGEQRDDAASQARKGGDARRAASPATGGDSSAPNFADLDPEAQRVIAAKGGQAAQASGNAHQFTRKEAVEGGRNSHEGAGGSSTRVDKAASADHGGSKASPADTAAKSDKSSKSVDEGRAGSASRSDVPGTAKPDTASRR